MNMTPAPRLEHDAMMKRQFNSQVSTNGYIERAIVWNLCAHLQANGWHVSDINDGDDITQVDNAQHAMELIFNLDEAWLFFRKGRDDHAVYLVLGNGEDIISDWNYATNDPDRFNAAMEAFDASNVAPALLTYFLTA